MTQQQFALAMAVIVAVTGTVFVSRVTAWSFSAARRRRLMVRDHARAARHRANRRTA